MKKKTNVRTFILILITASATVFVLKTVDKGQVSELDSNSVESTRSFSDGENQEFISITGAVDMNSGLTIERLVMIDPLQGGNIVFRVYNHTEESVIFSNQGFGLVIYAYDDQQNSWVIPPRKYKPYSQPVVLPPKFESWDPDFDNSWVVFEDEISNLGFGKFRFYISGAGQSTGLSYGAYLDIALEAPN